MRHSPAISLAQFGVEHFELHGSCYQYPGIAKPNEKWLLVTYSSFKRLVAQSTNNIFCELGLTSGENDPLR